VEGALDPDLCAEVDGTMLKLYVTGESTVYGVAIGAENRIWLDEGAENFLKNRAVGLGENGIECCSGAIPGNEDWGLLMGKSPLCGGTAPFSRWSRQMAFPLVGFKEVGFVCFDDVFKRIGFCFGW
jgi:hypothetical protein